VLKLSICSFLSNYSGILLKKGLKTWRNFALWEWKKLNIGKIGNLFWISYINLNKMSTFRKKICQTELNP